MKIEIRLRGQMAGDFDSSADLQGWVQAEPATMGPAWSQISVNQWTQGTGVANKWLEGLLPEGLSREPFEARTAAEKTDPGLERNLLTVLWANWDHEYAGAIEIVRDDRPKGPVAWDGITETDIGKLIQQMAQERAEQRRPRWPLNEGWRKSALTGMRGKLALRRHETGWAIATGNGLSTWIVKHEDRPNLPGEAGTEAIMQRALAHIGVRTARTEARMFGGAQCVLSKRSDRRDEGNRVVAIHQEDFLQASGWDPRLKYEERKKEEPGYVQLYRILGTNARDPAAEQAMLTRLIAACVSGANADMHRKNIGLLHDERTAHPQVTLAPVYDFGSWAGLERAFARTSQSQGKLALSVNRIDEAPKIGLRQWMAMAADAGVDPEAVVDEVRAVGRTLPDAIAQGRTEARGTDENREQAWVDRRTQASIDYAKRRAKALENEIESRARKGHGRGLHFTDSTETEKWENEPRRNGHPHYKRERTPEGYTLTVTRSTGTTETLRTGLTLSEIAKTECEDRGWPAEAEWTVRRELQREDALKDAVAMIATSAHEQRADHENMRGERSTDDTPGDQEKPELAPQRRAPTEAQAPTPHETDTARRYLLGSRERPSLETMIDKIVTERLGGSTPTQRSTAARESHIHWLLKPHTRERPEPENQWQIDRDNLGPIRSDAAAREAAKLLAQALDRYQRDQYGQTEEGAPRGPPPREHFIALTAKGVEQKRKKRIADTIEGWRSAIAPNLLRNIGQAIIPLEIDFRRALAQHRRADKLNADSVRTQASAELTRGPSRPPEWNWD